MTKTQKHHWLFRLWIKVRGLLAAVVVLIGVAIGLLSLLLPFESLYQKQLERFLSKQWNLTVEVEEINGSWRGYGPYFLLNNLSLRGKQTINLASASLSVNVYQMLLPGGRTGIDLSINKAELDMIHSSEGATITINDEQDEARFTEMLDRVLTSGSLRVDELTLNVANQAGDILMAGLQADFLLEQDQDNRALKLFIQNDQSNQYIEVKSLGKKTQSLTKDAKWYIKFHQFELTQLKQWVNDIELPQGKLDGELWLSAIDGHINSATGDLTWSNSQSGLSFHLTLKQSGELNNWSSLWRIDQLSIQNKAMKEFEVNIQRRDNFSELKSSAVPISLLADIVGDLLAENKELSALIKPMQGEIKAIGISYNHDNKDLQGHLSFENLSTKHPKLDFAGVTGEISLVNQQVNVLLDANQGHLTLPDVFRGRMDWQELSSQFSINYQQDDLQLVVNNFWCACDDFNLQLWLKLNLAEVNHLILNSRVSAVNVAELWKYWPHNVWKEKTLNWLDNSLIKGEVETGFVFVHGDLVPEGFKIGAAEFISRAYVKDTTNQFKPEWPVVEKLNATAVFNHDSVHVQVGSGETKNIMITESSVAIESLDEGVLTVDMTAEARNNQLLNYLNQSPLSSNIVLSDRITLRGKQSVALNFDIELKSEAKQEFKPQGKLKFSNGEFSTEHFVLENINGPVTLSGYDLLLKDLPATLESAPVKLNGKIATKSATGLAIDVNIDGKLSAELLLEKVSNELPITGESDWHINIKNQQEELLLTASSDLVGISSDLPTPLNKEQEESKTISIECNIPCEKSLVQINYANQIKSTLNQDSGQYHLSQLKFTAADVPSTQVNPFGGYIKELNLDQWLSLIAEHKKSDQTPTDLPFEEFELTIEQLTFMSRQFNNIQLQISRQPESYEININSEAISGLVILADDIDRKGIVAQFSHLNWIDAIESVTAVNPSQSSVPDIHLYAENFSYSNIPLGSLRLEMRNVADGIKIEQMNLKSPLAEINISGAWNKATGAEGQSKFNIVMFSEKIADFLQTVGFNAPITNAQTLIKMDAEWNGVPSEFNIANIDGELEISLGRGEVLDQQPGFGRVLGLFNLTNLPRRLLLDFRDVLAEGLLFNSMEGHFIITAGVANTDDFLISASSAKIHIKGDVGFADQSYDQTITIRPQIGKTFPTIGAIAGGPVGAAAGFLVQGLFNKQLKDKNEIIYRVTGTWDEPLIELISDE